jgi:hypothetical protein
MKNKDFWSKDIFGGFDDLDHFILISKMHSVMTNTEIVSFEDYAKCEISSINTELSGYLRYVKQNYSTPSEFLMTELAQKTNFNEYNPKLNPLFYQTLQDCLKDDLITNVLNESLNTENLKEILKELSSNVNDRLQPYFEDSGCLTIQEYTEEFHAFGIEYEYFLEINDLTLKREIEVIDYTNKLTSEDRLLGLKKYAESLITTTDKKNTKIQKNKLVN